MVKICKKCAMQKLLWNNAKHQQIRSEYAIVRKYATRFARYAKLIFSIPGYCSIGYCFLLQLMLLDATKQISNVNAKFEQYCELGAYNFILAAMILPNASFWTQAKSISRLLHVSASRLFGRNPFMSVRYKYSVYLKN